MRQKVIFEIDNIDGRNCSIFNPITGYNYGYYQFDGLEKDLPGLLYIEHNKVSDLKLPSIPHQLVNNKLGTIYALKDRGFSFEAIKEMIEKGWVWDE